MTPIAYILRTIACAIDLAVIWIVGCDNQISNSPPSAKVAVDTETEMYRLVTDVAVEKIMRNVDRPFDIQWERPIVDINPKDPGIAKIAIPCSVKENGVPVNRLYYLVFENKRAPARAKTKDDLVCLLANAHGKVLERDDDFWTDIPTDDLQKLGAVETDGPPFMATMLLELRGMMEKGVIGQ